MRITNLIAGMLLCAAPVAAADRTLFFDDFQDGEADGWSAGGNGEVAINDYSGSITLRLTGQAYAVTTVAVDGATRVTAGAAFAANDLEGDDRCLAQLSLDGGKSWITLVRVVDGQDDNLTMHGSAASQPLKDGQQSVMLLARIAGNSDDDTCYLDNAFVRGDVAAASTDRRILTARFLNGDRELAAPVAMSEFAPAEDSRPPGANWSGRLRLETDDEPGFEVLYDEHGRSSRAGVGRLPAFDFGFVQRGSDMVPLEQAVVRREHPYWEIVLRPGKAWVQPGDGRWTRAAVPFALQERAANCTHNGVMTWLFDSDGAVSRVAYQVSSETCAYFRFDLWGVAVADRVDAEAGDAGIAAVERMDRHRAARLPVRTLDALAAAYPATDPYSFAYSDGVNPRDLTVLGFVADGIHYRGGCETRAGDYPYCDELALPSYSTAKSIFAGLGLMRAERLEPGVGRRRIASVIPECDASRWQSATVEDALDMATGLYGRPGPSADEDSRAHLEFIFSGDHDDKLAAACSLFERRSAPGTTFAYHTSDTYLVGVALERLVGEIAGKAANDFYDDVLVPLWRALEFSPLLDVTKRTYDAAAQPFAGYGLTVEADDWIRIADWIANDAARIGGEPMLDTAMLDTALQRIADDRGLPAGSDTLRYQHGFWAFNARDVLGCSEDLWIPFMSGFGGITVAMMPNGIIYYYASDGYVHRWRSGIRAAHAVEAMCK